MNSQTSDSDEALLSNVTIDVEEIRSSYERVVAAGETLLEYALDCGRLLIAAKDKVEHGQWEPWLKANLPEIHIRTASKWMLIASKAKEIEDIKSAKSVREACTLAKMLPAKEAKAAGKKKATALDLIQAFMKKDQILNLADTDFSQWSTDDLEAYAEQISRVGTFFSAVFERIKLDLDNRTPTEEPAKQKRGRPRKTEEKESDRVKSYGAKIEPAPDGDNRPYTEVIDQEFLPQ
jgi:hypothetical protein